MEHPDDSAPAFFSESSRVKLFTLAEAARTLPLVRRIVGDIVAQFPHVRDLQREHARLKSVGAKTETLDDVECELGAAAERVNRLIRELKPIGCQFKDPAQGLVDFPAQHDGRVVLLCWKHGEDRIEYWHELDDGFPGRRPVAELSPETVG